VPVVGRDGIMSRDKATSLKDDQQYLGLRYSPMKGKLLYEIHGDGIPSLSGIGSLLEQSIRLMMHRFGSEQVVHDLQ